MADTLTQTRPKRPLPPSRSLLTIPVPMRTPETEAIKAAESRHQAHMLVQLGPNNWNLAQARAWLHHHQNAITAQAFADDPTACARGYL